MSLAACGKTTKGTTAEKNVAPTKESVATGKEDNNKEPEEGAEDKTKPKTLKAVSRGEEYDLKYVNFYDAKYYEFPQETHNIMIGALSKLEDRQIVWMFEYYDSLPATCPEDLEKLSMPIIWDEIGPKIGLSTAYDNYKFSTHTSEVVEINGTQWLHFGGDCTVFMDQKSKYIKDKTRWIECYVSYSEYKMGVYPFMIAGGLLEDKERTKEEYEQDKKDLTANLQVLASNVEFPNIEDKPYEDENYSLESEQSTSAEVPEPIVITKDNLPKGAPTDIDYVTLTEKELYIDDINEKSKTCGVYFGRWQNKQMDLKNKGIIIPNVVEKNGVRYKVVKIGCFIGGNYKAVILPEGLEQILAKTFSRNADLTYLYLPSTVKKIGEFAIEETKSLKKIDVPKGIVDIAGAFKYSYLEEISLPSSIEKCERTFEGCSELKKVEFEEPSNLKEAGEAMFFRCTSLKELTLPEGVKSIGVHILTHSAVEVVKIPSTIPIEENDEDLEFLLTDNIKKVIGPNNDLLKKQVEMRNIEYEVAK